jgi:insertion element IS1 protein InsB
VKQVVLQHLNPESVEVEIWRADELEVRRGLSSELDEMWSYVRSKTNPRWLWHAIDHHTGKVLAYVFGRRQDTVFLELKVLLEPFGITRYFTDGWGAYERHVEAEQHTVGKAHTQKIESKHINLRTRIKRLVRRTICFSKTEHMHDLVIGLFINRYEFRAPRSPKFGGKSQIALSSGDERDTDDHHGARRRYSVASRADAADGSPDVVGYAFSHPRQLDRSQLGLGEHDLAQFHFVPG